MAAAAHGDIGVLELVSTEPVDDDSVHYVVELTYENDGEHVSSAEVVLTAGDVAPNMMTADGDGLYSATVDFPSPGDYDILITVEEPTAELEVEQVVEAAPNTTATTVDGTTMTTTTADPSAVAAVTTSADAEGGSTWLLVVMAIIVAAMITVAVAYFRGRKQRQQPPTPPTPTTPSTD
jgi:hypothetical protein